MNDEPPNSSPKTLVWDRSSGKASTRDCKIAESCQTCLYINNDYQTGLQDKYHKGLEVLKASGSIDGCHSLGVVGSPRRLHYRTHAKLAVRPGSGESRFAIGLFKKGTHDIIDMTDCPLHKESMNRLIHDLKIELEASPKIAPYDESTLTGDLRYVTIRATQSTEAIMITFVVTKKLKQAFRAIVSKLKGKGHRIVSAHMNVHTENSNNIFSDDSTLISGVKRLRETLCEQSFEISPTSFFQVNPWMAELIYRRIEELAREQEGNNVAWDLYSGIGQISMMLASLGYKTLGIEQNPQATRDAQNNGVLNELQNQLHFIAGKVEHVQGAIPDWAWPPDIIVANPSRKGISDEMLPFVVRALNKGNDPLFLYMSCEVKTLATNLAHLQEQGYKCRQIEAFDMFPYTEKLEWLAVVQRA